MNFWKCLIAGMFFMGLMIGTSFGQVDPGDLVDPPPQPAGCQRPTINLAGFGGWCEPFGDGGLQSTWIRAGWEPAMRLPGDPAPERGRLELQQGIYTIIPNPANPNLPPLVHVNWVTVIDTGWRNKVRPITTFWGAFDPADGYGGLDKIRVRAKWSTCCSIDAQGVPQFVISTLTDELIVSCEGD